jgi:hypothetical protein
MKEKEVENKSKLWGIIALILGIIALILCWVPFLGLLLGIAALIMSIVGIKKQSGKGMAIAGLVLGILALIVAIISSLISGTIVYFLLSGNNNQTYSSANVPEYKIGDKVTIAKQDNVAYTVKSAEKAEKIKVNTTQGPAEIKPKGIFLLVKIDIENIGKKATNALNTELSLVDKENRTFEPDINTQAVLPNTLGSEGIRIQPGMPITITEIYDIPISASGLKLEIVRFGFFFAREPQARVDLAI